MPAERTTTRHVERRAGRHGELALIERDGELEIISNGVFLMDTRDGRSERLLVAAALEAAPQPVRRLLIGGLGVGFSLAEAIAHGVPDILVVESEPAVIAWNATHTGSRTGGRLDSTGVRCHEGDLVAWLREVDEVTDGVVGEVFDVICLDVDNGPDWVVDASNAWLYTDDGLRALASRLVRPGVLAVWAASPSPGFEERLRRSFQQVVTHTLPVARGEPDVVYVAAGAR